MCNASIPSFKKNENIKKRTKVQNKYNLVDHKQIKVKKAE
jgi:hypothetical protein